MTTPPICLKKRALKNELPNIYINTFKNSETLEDCLMTWIKYPITLIDGYDLSTQSSSQIKPNTVCFMNFKDKMLDMAIKDKKGLLYVEDDILLMTELTLDLFEYDLNRIGWFSSQRGGIFGTGIVYLSHKALLKIKEEIDNYKPQHFDRYLSNFSERMRKTADFKIHKEIDFPWLERAHISLNTGTLRTHKHMDYKYVELNLKKKGLDLSFLEKESKKLFNKELNK